MTKKKVAIIASIVIAILLLIAGVSYAYYSANVKEVNKTETVIKTNELTIVYTGTEEINVSGIVPGDSFTKKFTVENTSNVPVTYNIYLEGITNEFNEDLVYTLKDKDGEIIEEEVLPSTNSEKTYLITDIEIDSNELKEYEMTIEFKYSDKDQNKLQGKNFIATLGIDTTPVKIVKVVNDKLELDKLNSGDTVTKTFSVKNLSKETQSYDLKLSDVVSTYGDNLTYSLTKNGTEVVSNETMPTSDAILLSSQVLAATSTDEYVMTINFDGTTAALEYILAAENDSFSAKISSENKGLLVEDIAYSGKEEIFITPCSGTYKLETWGGQGGSQTGVAESNGNKSNVKGGYGAYSTGEIYLEQGEELFINVGGQGQDITARNYGGTGGYNGGGNGGTSYNSNHVGSAGGGGATHIALETGLLKNVTDKNNMLIVSGGGGGASWIGTGYQEGFAGHAGGAIGNSIIYDTKTVNGATQEMGYAFGQGQNGKKGFNGAGDCEGTGGGGGGYYGGYAYQHSNSGTNASLSGAGGSGFIGNTLLTNKYMTCYECEPSEEESSKTLSNKNVSQEAMADSAKIGNGHARITLLSCSK